MLLTKTRAPKMQCALICFKQNKMATTPSEYIRNCNSIYDDSSLCTERNISVMSLRACLQLVLTTFTRKSLRMKRGIYCAFLRFAVSVNPADVCTALALNKLVAFRHRRRTALSCSSSSSLFNQPL